MLELDEVVAVVETDDDESVRSALRLSLCADLVSREPKKKQGILLCGAVEHSALPLGVACLEVKLETLTLKGGLKCFGATSRHLDDEKCCYVIRRSTGGR